MSHIKIHIENTSDKTKLVSISEILQNVQADKDIHYAFRNGDQKLLDKMHWAVIRLNATYSLWDIREEKIIFRDKSTGRQHHHQIEKFFKTGQLQSGVLDISHETLTDVSNSVVECEIAIPLPGNSEIQIIFLDQPIEKSPPPSSIHVEKLDGKELEIKFAGNNVYHPFSVVLGKFDSIIWEFPEFEKGGITLRQPIKLNCKWEDWPGPPMHTKKIDITLFSRDGNEITFHHRDLCSYDRQFFEALWNMISFTFVQDGKPFSFYAKKQPPVSLSNVTLSKPVVSKVEPSKGESKTKAKIHLQLTPDKQKL